MILKLKIAHIDFGTGVLKSILTQAYSGSFVNEIVCNFYKISSQSLTLHSFTTKEMGTRGHPSEVGKGSIHSG